MKFSKNALLTVTVTDMNNLGCGIAKIDNAVIFIPNACTGDELEVKIIKVASHYLVGRIEKIIKPSVFRVESDCPFSKRCGGCSFRHITYAHELDVKQGIVEAAMKRAGLNINVHKVISAGQVNSYRNKAQYPVRLGKDGKSEIGFYAEKSHNIISGTGEGCLLQPPVFGKIIGFIKNFVDSGNILPYDEISHSGILRHIFLRYGEVSGEILVCFVVLHHDDSILSLSDAVAKEFPSVASIYENINPARTNIVLGKQFNLLYGKEKLRDVLCQRTFDISPDSFYQVNHNACELLYSKAAELADVQAGERVLDLFCGIGTVGLSSVSPDSSLFGIEIVENAVLNAKSNALLNSFANAEFICCDASDSSAVESVICEIAGSGLDLIFLDPPRKGCSENLLNMLAERSDARIVYISCNPDTLARDIKSLLSLGYSCSDAFPVDMFPRTGHVETVCLLSRKP